MSLIVKVSDGKGRGEEVEVLDNCLLTHLHTCPPLVPQKSQVFSQKVTNDGTATGSDDLGVDGSVTPVEFWIPADEDNDRYISVLSFILGYGSGAQLWEFVDSGAPLVNGIKLSYFNTNEEEIVVMSLKSNYSFMRASLAPYGVDNWEDRGFAGAGDYGFYITVPLDRMLPPYGVKLDRGTAQKFMITVRDDCTDADLFNCDAFGFDRFK